MLDSSGNFVSDTMGAVLGESNTFKSVESSFHQDLNGDGAIGIPQTLIESVGSTGLAQSGNEYFLNPVGGAGPSIDYNGAPVPPGQFGGWTPIGAEATAGGYEVAWKYAGQDLYTVWMLDSSGNFVSDTMGAVLGESNTFKSVESSFHQDLNGDGTIGAPASTVAASVYAVPDGIQNVVLTGTAAQAVTANNIGDTITSNDYGSTLIGGAGNDTLIAGHGADQLTGGAGADAFVFNYLPWNAGHITDFNTANDTINFSGIFTSIGYSGNNPVADGYLSFESDGAGDTKIYVHPQGPSTTIPILITIVDHVSPSQITSGDWIFHA
jgi:Ca2+-binding RTX toxin-like protein